MKVFEIDNEHFQPTAKDEFILTKENDPLKKAKEYIFEEVKEKDLDSVIVDSLMDYLGFESVDEMLQRFLSRKSNVDIEMIELKGIKELLSLNPAGKIGSIEKSGMIKSYLEDNNLETIYLTGVVKQWEKIQLPMNKSLKEKWQKKEKKKIDLLTGKIH